MDPTPWTPPLRLDARDGRCRLHLDGVTYGNGPTLQDAANDLLARLFDVARGVHAGAAGLPRGVDLRVAGFLWEIGELIARGGDVRARVFGS